MYVLTWNTWKLDLSGFWLWQNHLCWRFSCQPWRNSLIDKCHLDWRLPCSPVKRSHAPGHWVLTASVLRGCLRELHLAVEGYEYHRCLKLMKSERISSDYYYKTQVWSGRSWVLCLMLYIKVCLVLAFQLRCRYLRYRTKNLKWSAQGLVF